MPAANADPNDFSDKYNTVLEPETETAYNAWASENGRHKDVYDYDLRGAYQEMQSGDMAAADNGHLGDKYKKPNHPTFSNESIYHGSDGKLGGSWTENENGQTVFTPSKSNLENMSVKQLREYFNKIEPDVILNIPESLSEKLYPNQGK